MTDWSLLKNISITDSTFNQYFNQIGSYNTHSCSKRFAIKTTLKNLPKMGIIILVFSIFLLTSSSSKSICLIKVDTHLFTDSS